ncbi:unnamed protein product, partial [Gulo gulo]
DSDQAVEGRSSRGSHFSHEIQMPVLCGCFRNPPTGNKARFQNPHQRRPPERYGTVSGSVACGLPGFIGPFLVASVGPFGLSSQHRLQIPADRASHTCHLPREPLPSRLSAGHLEPSQQLQPDRTGGRAAG